MVSASQVGRSAREGSRNSAAQAAIPTTAPAVASARAVPAGGGWREGCVVLFIGSISARGGGGVQTVAAGAVPQPLTGCRQSVSAREAGYVTILMAAGRAERQGCPTCAYQAIRNPIMTQPLDTALALAQANVRLGVQLSDGWRDTGQQLADLGRRCVAEAADEARDALGKGPMGTLQLKARHGCWQDFIDETEVLHLHQVNRVEAAVDAWRDSLSKALHTEGNLPFETFVNVWLEVAKLASSAGRRRTPGFPLPE